eukprot:COSAG06_NODE_10558_length_1659_cov_1.713462_1_plen_56_part_10
MLRLGRQDEAAAEAEARAKAEDALREVEEEAQLLRERAVSCPQSVHSLQYRSAVQV